MENPVIVVEHLSHRYGKKVIYEDLNFSLEPGKIYALLGKNGVGKTTLIQILMGFLRPVSGRCRVLGEDSHNLSTPARTRIGLLFEGHLAYEFMSIAGIERFYARFYPNWNRDYYYYLTDKLKLPGTHLIKNMSCGQRSQVVLGLIMAQQPDLLLLDDYSIGLDAGFRRLFLDEIQEYLRNKNRTVFLTSHIIQDMIGFVDEVIFLERGGRLMKTSLSKFQETFRCYRVAPQDEHSVKSLLNDTSEVIKNIEIHAAHTDIFSFSDLSTVEGLLKKYKASGSKAPEMIEMSLEDAFIGYTGRY